ncbi:tetratricopeptide repeat protein [Methyloraptor flagellatus]|uniref:Tetratricopeptide repeat protein n=1 Tax=Methyloraptor flagellatus TaxID=3162530 RepID=A0AAU7X4V3_9HYPH
MAEFTVTAPPVSPFDWAAQIDDTAIVITGHIPNAAAKQGLAATAAHLWPDRRIDDRTVVADGAAPGFAAAAGIALGDLAALARGRVSLVDRAFTIEGTARTPEAYAAIGRSLAGLPAGYSTSDAKLEPPVASPYLSAIKVEGGEMTLAGYMPSEAARAEILANTGKTFPGRVTDGTTVAAGAPEGFPAAVAWGVGIAGRLTQAEISLRDAAISVTGKVKALDDIPALRGLAAAPPAGFTIASTAIGGRTDVAATDCDRLALPPSHPDRPQGVAGVALDAIDVAAALPACEAALAAAPDVRRFATALATVKLKQGDAKAAATLLASASAADDPTATARLAALKRDGLDGPADPKAAAMLAARAADAGDPLGMTVLAGLVEQGLGVPVDRARAADLYGRAAARGDLDALTALARLTEIGAAGPADPAKARDLYARAARGGSPFAMHALGRMLDKGLGGSADATEALDWYRRAADTGRPESMVAAGLMLAEGRGRPADAHAAGALFEKAAALGEPAAMYELGLQALDGRGRPKSEAIAVQWFERAAALGLPEAMGRLGFVALAGIGPGTGASPDFARARLWFVAGTKAGTPCRTTGWA